ncbi:MAG: AAA family ATPase [Candidatus Alcyoniella australis]|nr:AAA family ATPase [Candidatus Alcyoniella australis]
MSKMIIAVCGKGGVGKTTVSAMISRSLFLSGKPRTLLVDADPSSGLAIALGMEPERTVEYLRNNTIGEVRQGRTDKRDLAQSLDYLLLDALVERGNLALLSIGRPEQRGCYCSVNSLLREAIELLAGQFDLVLIDAEAGVEQVNREVLRGVDKLLLVGDTSQKSLRVTMTIDEVARKYAADIESLLLINRVRETDEYSQSVASTNLKFALGIPEDGTVREYDAEARSFLQMPDCPATAAVDELLALMRLT